jgi:hypothetical protein
MPMLPNNEIHSTILESRGNTTIRVIKIEETFSNKFCVIHVFFFPFNVNTTKNPKFSSVFAQFYLRGGYRLNE